MKFEDYFSTPYRDKIIRQLAQTDLCPHNELILGCGCYNSCNECWEDALTTVELTEIERRKRK